MTPAGRVGLAVGGVAVAGLLVGLFLAVRAPAATKDHPSPIAHEHATPPADAAPAPTAIKPAPTPTPTPTPLPEPPDAGPRVHDHLAEDGGPPAPRSALSEDTRVAMRAAIAPFVQTCSSHLRELNPPVHGRVLVSIDIHSASGHLTAHDVAVSGDPGIGQDVMDCISQALTTVDVESPTGQGDANEMTRMLFVAP